MRKEKREELNSYIEELKTVRYELTSSNKFLSIESYKCLLNNGIIIPREKIIKNKKNGDAAIILPITKEKNTILTVQPRVFTKLTVGIGLPAGYVEDNEEHIIAAKRELQEETGYTTDNIIEVCSFYQDDGCSGAYNKGFLARDCQKTSNQMLDKDEFIRYFECNIDELEELVMDGYINDGGSQLLIERAKKYIR